jgi:tetratricopeptide (TPR) repeat protein
MWRYKRLAWVGGGCAVLLVMLIAILRYSHRLPDLSPSLQVEARCGVAAGGMIAGKRAQVTCGLTTAEIEAVIAQAITAFDLQALVEQAQKNQIKDVKALETLAEKLGLTPEAAINILKSLKKTEPSPVHPAKSLAALIAPHTHIVVELRDPSIKPDDNRSQTSPRASPLIKDMPQASKEEVQEEIKRVLAECAIAAGTGIEFESIDIKCGPNEEEVGVIIERIVVKTDLATLLKNLRQGIYPDKSLLHNLANELHLTQNTFLRLLTLLANSDTPPYEISTELTTLVKKHVMFAQHAGEMRQDDAILRDINGQFYAAVASGDFARAEVLLRDYEVAKTFKEKEDNAIATREAQYQQRVANLQNEQEKQNLSQERYEKTIFDLNEELNRIKQGAEERAVLEQKLEQSQRQLATLEVAYEAQKNQMAALPQVLKDAEDALKRGESGNAEVIYQGILEVGGEQLAEASYQLGTLADGRRDFEAAYRYLNLAMQVRPKATKYTEAFDNVAEKVQHQWRQADIHSDQGNHDEAIALRRKILPLWETVWGPEHPRLADGLMTLANDYWAHLHYEQAVAHYQRAHQIWEAVLGAHHSQTAYMLGALGRLYRLSRSLEQSEQALQQAILANSEQIQRSSALIADNTTELGAVYEHKGQLDYAVEMYKQASMIYTGLDMKADAAENYIKLASVYKYRGTFDESEEMYKKALTIFEELNHREEVANIYINLGELYRYRSDLKKAEVAIESGLAIYEKMSHLEGIANSANALGNIYVERADMEKAGAMYRKALGINETLKRKLSIAFNQGNLANVYSAQNDLEQAKKLIQAALRTFEDAEEESAMAWLYGNLGSILIEQNTLDEAQAFIERAMSIYEKLGRPLDIAKSYAYLGRVYEARSDLSQAEAMYGKSLETNKKYNLKYEMAFNYRGLAYIYLRQGKREQAKAMFHNAHGLFEELGNSYQAKLMKEQLGKLQ